jgi:mannose-6-phosphate isomerase class I
MGTHPSLPSKLAVDGSSLKEFLEKNDHLLGERVQKHYNGKVFGSWDSSNKSLLLTSLGLM